MQRALEIAKLCVYLLGMLVMLWVGYSITSSLSRLDRDMDRRAIQHEQMLQEHVLALQDLEQRRKDHERRMQEHERRMQQQ
jgi:Flp pilus assembly protein TadB